MSEVKVCIGSACHVKGSYNIIQSFQQLLEEHKKHDEVELKAQFCMKRCEHDGVCVSVDEVKYNILPENAREFFRKTVLAK